MADAEANIAELAKESRQKDKRNFFPPIPLVVLAPLLVVAALIAVVVPSSIILNKASSDTAELLAGEYLDSLLNNVQVQVRDPVNKFEPLVEGLMRNPVLGASFDGPLINMYASPAVPLILSMGESYQLASLACYTAHWKTGYNSSYPLVNDNFLWLASVDHVVIQYATYGDIQLLGVTEPSYGVGLFAGVYPYINQTAYLYYPYTYTLIDPSRLTINETGGASYSFSIDPQMPPATLEMLGRASSAIDFNSTSFSISAFANGWTVGYVSRVHFPDANSAALPDYACAAGLRVDDQWNTLLRGLKPPIADSVVAIYGADLSIVASSNMEVDNAVLNSGALLNTDSGALFTTARPDVFTILVQTDLKARYSSGAAALSTIGSGVQYNANFQDRSWIVNAAVISMTARDTDRFLLVVAIPHSEIYGVIDSARVRSLGLSIGIAVGIAVLIAGLFVAITLPLSRLAAQMVQLTKLDFGTLESSGALERRSLILEVGVGQNASTRAGYICHNVQARFATAPERR
ncbi:hypothetical protein HDU87_004332 [Geranomyces variabilis]|uniref:Uncharacterized protein n=1 Tax=Geranomyces variabilis TaxID=109894 RepID=A0AAD5TIU4_9FUNG|nr:hypothetical protein HDU87_004332 [Geranomyces variabilis]